MGKIQDQVDVKVVHVYTAKAPGYRISFRENDSDGRLCVETSSGQTFLSDAGVRAVLVVIKAAGLDWLEEEEPQH